MFRSLEAKFEFIDFNPKHKTVYNNSWNVTETRFFLCKGCQKWLTAGENIIYFMVLAGYSDLLGYFSDSLEKISKSSTCK